MMTSLWLLLENRLEEKEVGEVISAAWERDETVTVEETGSGVFGGTLGQRVKVESVSGVIPCFWHVAE